MTMKNSLFSLILPNYEPNPATFPNDQHDDDDIDNSNNDKICSDDEDDDDTSDAECRSMTSESKHVDVPLATLHRMANHEQESDHCWSEPSANTFSVRGPDYLKNKVKISSGDYLLQARGCDFILTDSLPPTNIGRNPNILGGALRKVPTFIINFRFPWGVMVLYFEIPQKYTPFLNASSSSPPSTKGLSPAEIALARFLMEDDDKKRNSSFKLIPRVTDGPWVVKQMVTGTPTLIGNKLPLSYTYEPAVKHPETGEIIMSEYLEADLNIGNSSTIAQQIVSICKLYMKSLTFELGFVIQGNSQDELPEQMLGSVRIHCADPDKAPVCSNLL